MSSDVGPDEPAIDVRGLDLHHAPGARPVLRGLSLVVPAAARCLLVGDNDAGKSTLLAVLAGRLAPTAGTVRVLGQSPDAATLRERVALVDGRATPGEAGTVADLLAGTPHDEDRRERLSDALRVDPGWRLAGLSPTQRRRVRLLVDLLPPRDLLLLDEPADGLDVGTRTSVLRFVRRDADRRDATVVLATHVLDGLEDWATHVAVLGEGRVRLCARLDEIRELEDLRDARVASPLHRLIDRWLRD